MTWNSDAIDRVRRAIEVGCQASGGSLHFAPHKPGAQRIRRANESTGIICVSRSLLCKRARDRTEGVSLKKKETSAFNCRRPPPSSRQSAAVGIRLCISSARLIAPRISSHLGPLYRRCLP